MIDASPDTNATVQSASGIIESTTENIVMTLISREKFARAHKGEIPLPILSKIAFGNGGHDALGPKKPTEDMINVPGEFIRKNIESIEVVGTSVKIIGVLDFAEGNDIGEVSSVGIYDSDGDLVGIKNFKVTPKANDSAIEVTWEEIF